MLHARITCKLLCFIHVSLECKPQKCVYLPLGCTEGQVELQHAHTELSPYNSFHLNHKQSYQVFKD